MTKRVPPKLTVLFFGVAAIAIFLIILPSLLPSPQSNIDLLITNAQVVTLDPHSRVYTRGWIAINDSKIIAVGNSQTVPYRATKTINANGKVALPGLINTHSHAAMTLLRGRVESQPLADWLSTVSADEQRLTSEHVYWGTLLAISEMIRSGTTTFNDMYFYPETTAKAVAEAGMRAIVRLPLKEQGEDLQYDQALVNQYPQPGLITFSLAPNPLLDYSLPQLKKISAAALADDLLVHLHFEETPAARTDALTRFGQTPLQLLAQAGLLTNQLVLAHSVDLTDSELDLLAQHPSVGIAYNPKSNLKLSGQTADVPAMLRRNLTVGFGTDGAASSNSLDLFSHMNFAAVGFLKCQDLAPYCQNQYTVSPEKIVRLATIDGAKVVGLAEQVGSIEVGKYADIILIDLQQPHLVPTYDIYATLVYSTTGHDVTDSIIHGRLVMENKIIITVDEKEIITTVESIATTIKSGHPNPP